MQWINALANYVDGPRDPKSEKFPYWPLLSPAALARFRHPHTGNTLSAADGSFDRLNANRFSVFLASFPRGASVIVDIEDSKTCDFHFSKPREKNEAALTQVRALLELLRRLRPDLKYALNCFPYTDSGETWKNDPAKVDAFWAEQVRISQRMRDEILPLCDALAFELYYRDRWGDVMKNCFENQPGDPLQYKSGWWHALNLACNAMAVFGKPLLWVFTPGYEFRSRPESYDPKAGFGKPISVGELEQLLKFARGYGGIKQIALWGATDTGKFRRTTDRFTMPIWDENAPWWKWLKTIW